MDKSGFKIAMRDLSIRGAGDILGSEQSGFIDSVGLELYMKLLKKPQGLYLNFYSANIAKILNKMVLNILVYFDNSIYVLNSLMLKI